LVITEKELEHTHTHTHTSVEHSLKETLNNIEHDPVFITNIKLINIPDTALDLLTPPHTHTHTLKRHTDLYYTS